MCPAMSYGYGPLPYVSQGGAIRSEPSVGFDRGGDAVCAQRFPLL